MIATFALLGIKILANKLTRIELSKWNKRRKAAKAKAELDEYEVQELEYSPFSIERGISDNVPIIFMMIGFFDLDPLIILPIGFATLVLLACMDKYLLINYSTISRNQSIDMAGAIFKSSEWDISVYLTSLCIWLLWYIDAKAPNLFS